MAVVPLAAADWPQWRGPGSRGVATDAALPVTWSATEHVAWRAPLAGLGTSSPIVVGDRVVVTSQVGATPTARGAPQLARDDQSLAARETPLGGRQGGGSGPVTLVVEAFDRAAGTRLWEFRTPAVGPFTELHEKHNLATPTPVTTASASTPGSATARSWRSTSAAGSLVAAPRAGNRPF